MAQLLSLFEEEEEGIGIASNIINVKGEDPATPWLFKNYLRSVDTRKPRDQNDSPIFDLKKGRVRKRRRSTKDSRRL